MQDHDTPPAAEGETGGAAGAGLEVVIHPVGQDAISSSRESTLRRWTIAIELR